MSIPIPGFDSPAVGFDQPFEMLAACHDRVRRSLSLLARLLEHLSHHPHDARSRSAASDVLRYFDLAAPLHHQDEERHLFARLAASGDTALAAQVAQLRADHLEMESWWRLLRPTLVDWSGEAARSAPTDEHRRWVTSLLSLYERHMRVEESVVFPAARALTDEAGLRTMSAEMAGRRTASGP